MLFVSGDYMGKVAVVLINAVLLSLLIVPFFLIYNGIVMIRKEGKHLSQLLSLGLGLAILLGEAATPYKLAIHDGRLVLLPAGMMIIFR